MARESTKPVDTTRPAWRARVLRALAGLGLAGAAVGVGNKVISDDPTMSAIAPDNRSPEPTTDLNAAATADIRVRTEIETPQVPSILDKGILLSTPLEWLLQPSSVNGLLVTENTPQLPTLSLRYTDKNNEKKSADFKTIADENAVPTQNLDTVTLTLTDDGKDLIAFNVIANKAMLTYQGTALLDALRPSLAEWHKHKRDTDYYDKIIEQMGKEDPSEVIKRELIALTWKRWDCENWRNIDQNRYAKGINEEAKAEHDKEIKALQKKLDERLHLQGQPVSDVQRKEIQDAIKAYILEKGEYIMFGFKKNKQQVVSILNTPEKFFAALDNQGILAVVEQLHKEAADILKMGADAQVARVTILHLLQTITDLALPVLAHDYRVRGENAKAEGLVANNIAGLETRLHVLQAHASEIKNGIADPEAWRARGQEDNQRLYYDADRKLDVMRKAVKTGADVVVQARNESAQSAAPALQEIQRILAQTPGATDKLVSENFGDKSEDVQLPLGTAPHFITFQAYTRPAERSRAVQPPSSNRVR